MDTKETRNLNTPTAESSDVEVQSHAAAEWKSWLTTLGIAGLVVLAVVLYRNNKSGNEESASRMLGEARNVQALQAIMNQYPKTSAAQIAQLQMAKAQYDNGDYVASRSGYQAFLSKYPQHPMAGIAELGLIHCSEGAGQTEAALAEYTRFVAKNPNHFLTPTALFGKARCLQTLKRYAEARAVYEDFLASHPKSEWGNEVTEALKQLDREARKITEAK